MNSALLQELFDHYGGPLDLRVRDIVAGRGPTGDPAADLAALFEMPPDEARHLVNLANGHSSFWPASWGVEGGAEDAKGLTRLEIVR